MILGSCSSWEWMVSQAFWKVIKEFTKSMAHETKIPWALAYGRTWLVLRAFMRPTGSLWDRQSTRMTGSNSQPSESFGKVHKTGPWDKEPLSPVQGRLSLVQWAFLKVIRVFRRHTGSLWDGQPCRMTLSISQPSESFGMVHKTDDSLDQQPMRLICQSRMSSENFSEGSLDRYCRPRGLSVYRDVLGSVSQRLGSTLSWT